MHPQLKQLLTQASAEHLAQLLQSIYGVDKTVDQKIETALLQHQPQALAQQLKKRIQAIKRGKTFIDYRHSFAFSQQLDALLVDIASLLQAEPELTFGLIDQFMASHQQVYARCDDSSGSIGECYRAGVDVWLSAASRWRQLGTKCKLNWPAELLSRHNDNGYAVWDQLISASADLLTTQELQQMAWCFEADFKRAQDNNTEVFVSYPQLTASCGLAAVASALKDVALYEKSVLLHSAEPNELQKQSIVQFCLAVKDGTAALKWLDAPWSNEAARVRLLDNTLELLGRDKDLLALRRQVYDKQPDNDNLQALLAVLPPQEQTAVQQQAVSRAQQLDNTTLAISSLIALQALPEAAEQLLLRQHSLTTVSYYDLQAWAKAFIPAKQELAAILCYRVLLEDILQAARSKAYHHAASYYKQLAKLDAQIDSYQALPDWAEYQVLIRQQHGRKSAFWRHIN